jgi:tRNA/tmRNA/rRNA uracil-C5-methylase (TrmA/RlmC/RlmD family)
MRAPALLLTALRVRVRPGGIASSAAGLVSLGCEHFGSCPGCDISEHLESPPLLADARAFFSERGTELGTRWGSPRGYRTTAKLAVRREPGSGRVVVGLFARNSHSIVSLPNCVVHHPSINRAVELIQQAMRGGSGLSPYDEASTLGLLRYVQACVQRDTGRVQLTLVANARTREEETAVARFADLLWEAGGGEASWHSIWLNLNTVPNNVILSHQPGAWKLLLGDQLLIERLSSGAPIALFPHTFRQPNLDGFDGVVRAVVRAVPPGARVVEWYAGVGVLGLALVSRANVRWCRCSDVSPRAAFAASAGMLPAFLRKRVSYAVGAAAERLEDGAGADVAVVDPPRKGLDPHLLDALCDPLLLPSYGLSDTVGEGGAMGEGAAAGSGAQQGGTPGNGWRDGTAATGGAGEAALGGIDHQGYVASSTPSPDMKQAATGTDKPSIGAQPSPASLHPAEPLPRRSPCHGLRLLIYVSCGFDALRRDADRLLAAGWSIKRAEAHLLMLGANHLETVVTFERAGGYDAVAEAGARWAAKTRGEGGPDAAGQAVRAADRQRASKARARGTPPPGQPKNGKRADKLRARRERRGRQREQASDANDGGASEVMKGRRAAGQ